MPPHPRDGRKLLGHLQGAHTHHHDHIWRSRLRIRRLELRFGCHTVVCTSSSAARAAMGYWGQCPHTPGMAGHCLVTLGGHTHTTTTTFGAPDSVFDGLNCGSGVICRCHTVVCTSSSAARAAMGYWGQCPHTPGMAGHCLVTLGGHTHTSTTTFGVAHTWPTLYSVRIAQCGSGAVRWCAHHLQQLGPQWGLGGNVPTPQG
jgi:hypothetical protein